MALNNYTALQASILDWIARPGDPLVSPAVPDMIALFEEEARDRLNTRFNEMSVSVTPPPNSNTIPLPDDFGTLRELYVTTSTGNQHFQYQTPRNMDTNLWCLPDQEVAFTVEGLNLRFTGPTGPVPGPINAVYMQGITPLSGTTPTNWLLTNYPSTYLWGSLCFAALYIGDDPRAPTWLQAREAAFNRIELTDRKLRFPQGLMIQTDVRNP